MFRSRSWIMWVVLLWALPGWAIAGPCVYCWDQNTNQPGMVPMVQIDCSSNSVPAAIGKIAGGFAKLPPEQRVLLIRNLFVSPRLFTAANLPSIVMNGPDCTADMRYFRMLFSQMRAQHLIPSRIAIDCEESVSTWALKPANGTLSSVMMTVYGDPSCLAKLPASVMQY
ncbi:MAG TPA: hypothetical protein VG722_01950, partial [Tepidisphaeraceae bacterium]|nr:hypothetical protein [Tepidisphaeraceae bacterium]